MGSAVTVPSTVEGDQQKRIAKALADSIANCNAILFTGATTGLIYEVGRAAHENGTLHIGISPANSVSEHVEDYELPTDACDAIVYTGFGLKGRNVVLVRSCDIVLFIAGGMGTLNEFTIAHDEGKIIGCLAGTGGVADEANYLLEKFSHRPTRNVIKESNPDQLLETCIRMWTNE
jgi:uncharacterized protein (TIGR00725 family)